MPNIIYPLKFRKSLIIIIVLFVFLKGNVTLAQNNKIKFNHLTTNDGLSKNQIQAIFQDSKGFIWIATKDGLNKYDGYQFTIYRNNSKDSTSISSNNVRGIVEDSKGNLWILTDGRRINLFDRQTETFKSFEPSSNFGKDLTYNIAIDKKDNIYISYPSGILTFNTKNRKFYKTDFTGNDDAVVKSRLTFCLDHKNNIWLGFLSKGLQSYNLETKRLTIHLNETIRKSIVNYAIRSMYEDKQGYLWIGTGGAGLFCYNPITKKVIQYVKNEKNKNSLCSDNILSLFEDNQGNLWIGSENGGLSILDRTRKNFSNYKNEYDNPLSLSHNSIYSIFQDNKGTMWLGTFSGGVDYYDKSLHQFTHEKFSPVKNSIGNNIVTSFWEDKKGDLWITTDGGGLTRYDSKKGIYKNFQHDPHNKNSISTNFCLKVFEDSRGNIWVGTFRGGLNLLDKETGTFKVFKNIPGDSTSLGSNDVYTIMEDSEGILWMGTLNGGLCSFNPDTKKFRTFLSVSKEHKQEKVFNITTIFEDSKKGFWVGTAGSLYSFDKSNGSFTRIVSEMNNDSNLSYHFVTTIFEDSQGNVWMGTESGLNKLINRNTFSFQRFGVDEGLPNTYINSILEDNKGNLWISTNNGISCFNPIKRSSRNFEVVDGLQSNEFKRNSGIKTRNGLFYFGGVNGFNIFHPDSLKFNTTVPKVYITDFQIFNKSVKLSDPGSPLKKPLLETKEISLSHDQSVFSIGYLGLNYTLSVKNTYAFKLEGFDKSWNYVGSQRKTTYTNLDPGEYIFKVRASNNDGVWNNEGASIKIIINPPFWQTLWFRILVLITITSFVYAIYHARIRIIKRQKKILEQQVSERTAEVVQQKEELKVQSENVLKANEASKEQGEKLESVYNELKDSIRAALLIQESILPEKNYIKEHFTDLFIFNKPKDIISGDFYWFDVVDDEIIVAVADCTGHGVSGALMSIKGHHLLNDCIYPYKDKIASEILDRLNVDLVKAHKSPKEEAEINGMDISLCIIDKGRKKLQFAGAKNPLYLVRKGELIQVKADRMSIGFINQNNSIKFNNHLVDLQEGDILYLFSDGFADQLGGDTGMDKFLYTRFREMLIEISTNPMNEQVKILDEKFQKWKGDADQLDDILIAAFKI